MTGSRQDDSARQARINAKREEIEDSVIQRIIDALQSPAGQSISRWHAFTDKQLMNLYWRLADSDDAICQLAEEMLADSDDDVICQLAEEIEQEIREVRGYSWKNHGWVKR